MKRIVTVLVVMFILLINSNVNAICDTADISRLKEIAKNVEVSYEHNVYGDFNSDDPNAMLMSAFDFTVSGLPDDMYIMDDDWNTYYSEDAIDGVISFISFSGKRKVYIYSKTCEKVLDTRNFDLPVFNFNSLSDECKKDEFKDLDICMEFLDDKEEIIQGDEFKGKIEEIENNGNVFYNLLNFIKKNALYVLLGVIGLIALIVILVIKLRKRSVLE